MPTMASTGLPTAAPASTDYAENDRLYHGYRRGMYLFPCDEEEKDRMDIYHKIFEVARKGQLHSAPVNLDNPQDPARVLDVGCGTGIWAIDMADKYREAEVIGMDLSNIQPVRIPANLRFRVPRDYEGIWGLGENSYDLIHIQMQSGAVSSWPELYQKVFAHLKPGSGWIEQVEIDMEPRCDDGTLPEDSLIRRWYGWLVDATARNHRTIQYNHSSREQLRNAGFIDIDEKIIRAPLNGWPSDPHQKTIGYWYNLGLMEGVEALSLAPFYRMFQWDPKKHIKPLCEDLKQEISKSGMHVYHNIHIITARRPL